MKEITSQEFRRTYPRLTEPHAITVHGHLIGVWTPGGTLKDIELDFKLIERDERAISAIPAMSQKKRDRILRRISKSQ